MTREEQLNYLIRALSPGAALPERPDDKWKLFRALINLREPQPASAAFLEVQDALLQGELTARGITELSDLSPARGSLYVWKGDITTLRVDAIVNAANSGMTGCYCPLHGCVDNAIHTFAGVQLRLACAEMMRRQGLPEPAGQAKLTRAYNLPCRYVLHTVGPVVTGALRRRDCETLAACYRACLELAQEHGLRSVAFCCISTGEFHFPNQQAAEIAVQTVEAFLRTHPNLKVVFNVFREEDLAIYRTLLPG